jgi:hypothetical protein
MAVLTNAAFLSKWSTLFADNATRDISELDMRDFRQDISDSFLNKTDGGTVTGNVGIGGAPLTEFHVHKNNAATLVSRFQQAGSGGVELDMKRDGTTPSNWIMYLPPSSTELRFWSTADKFIFLPNGTLKLPVAPAPNNTEDAILVRNATSGEIQVRSKSTIASVSDGFYTPTLTNVSNVTATTAYEAYWLKVGTKVTVFGQLDIQATALGAAVVGMSFPVAVTTIFAHQASGNVSSGVEGETGHVKADDINLRAELTLNANGTLNHRIYYHYSYLVT